VDAFRPRLKSQRSRRAYRYVTRTLNQPSPITLKKTSFASSNRNRIIRALTDDTGEGIDDEDIVSVPDD
jgi:hypothetical protein